MTSSRRKPVILCFVAHYLPSYRSGGPVRTIANLVECLGGELDIRIVTSDRDAMDNDPFKDVVVDSWNRVGNAMVLYASKRTMTMLGVFSLLRNTSYDVLYLNSFFSYRFTFLPLLARWLGFAPIDRCILAPRGEFSPGALTLKPLKKSAYILISRFLKLHSSLYWQASSEFELSDIRRAIPSIASSIIVAPDLPSRDVIDEPFSLPSRFLSDQHSNVLRLVFLSRITPKKNLDFLLRSLRLVSSQVCLTIFGPLRDPCYWQLCQRLIRDLPPSVTVDYAGEVCPQNVNDVFSSHDLFVFPTLGENYGHVVFESLIAGTPVLISDQTPWQPSDDGAVRTLSIESHQAWASAIDEWAGVRKEELIRRSISAVNYAKNYVETSNVVARNHSLFLMAFRSALA